MSLISDARAFAHGAHGAINQVRKYTGEPYINHVAAVANMVSHHTPDSASVAAAWLHDTVEDTQVTHELIYSQFGTSVHRLVVALTNVDTSAGNRAKRFEINMARLAAADPVAKTVKLADLIDNTRSIVQHDPTFAPLYLSEKARLLEVLREGNAVLWQMAYEQVQRERRKLAS